MNLVPINVKVADSSPPECMIMLVETFSCVKVDDRKAREERELATSVKIDEHNKLRSGNTEPYARQNEGTYRGEEGKTKGRHI